MIKILYTHSYTVEHIDGQIVDSYIVYDLSIGYDTQEDLDILADYVREYSIDTNLKDALAGIARFGLKGAFRQFYMYYLTAEQYMMVKLTFG